MITRLFKYLCSFLLLLAFALPEASFAGLPVYFSQEVIGLQKLVEVAKDSFESAYFDTLIKNEKFFDDAYNNNLVISSEIDWNFANNGATFMKLIDFLEKKNDAESILILSRLNELYYLTFHQHLSHLDVPREKQVALISALHYLYSFKDANGKEVLRSMLTRVFIYTIMVEMIGLHYYEKKEVLFLAYEEFRAALKNLLAEHAINIEALKQVEIFINELSAYGMKEPIVKPHNFKRWVIKALLVGAVVGGVYYTGEHFGVWKNFSKIIDDAVKKSTKTFSDTLYQNFSVPTAKAMMDELEDRSVKLGEGLGTGAIDGMANDYDYVLVPPDVAFVPDPKNPDARPPRPVYERRNKRPSANTGAVGNLMGESLAAAAIDSLLYEKDGALVGRPLRVENRDLNKLIHKAGSGIMAGALDQVEGIAVTVPMYGNIVNVGNHATRLARKAASDRRADDEIEALAVAQRAAVAARRPADEATRRPTAEPSRTGGVGAEDGVERGQDDAALTATALAAGGGGNHPVEEDRVEPEVQNDADLPVTGLAPTVTGLAPVATGGGWGFLEGL